MMNLKNPAAEMIPVKKELIVMGLEDDDECMMDAEEINTSTESGEADHSNMQQIVSAANDNDDDDWDAKIDHQYMKLLDSFREDGDSYLRDNPLRCIRYDVDNGGYDKREFKSFTENKRRSREDRRNTIRVTKKNVGSKTHVRASTKKSTKEADLELRRRESLVKEKSVEAMLITSHVKRNSQRNVEANKEENSEGQMVLDENYRSYLTWLVENSKSSRTNPEKQIQVKWEEYTMSLSDSDIIAVEDHPFLDEEDSPFVPSKSYNVIDVDEDSGDQRSSWFRKEIMKVLKQPYNEREFMELNHEASVCRWLTRCRELRDGRELTYETKQMRPSYLDEYPDFKRKFEESLREKDRHRALNLLRGFIFYLTKVVRDDAFKPWLDPECLKMRCFEQKSSSSSSAIKLEL